MPLAKIFAILYYKEKCRRDYDTEKNLNYHEIQMTRDGRLSAAIEEDRRREVITSYSQLLCGAFDIAGEHEAEVIETMARLATGHTKDEIRKMAEDACHGGSSV